MIGDDATRTTTTARAAAARRVAVALALLLFATGCGEDDDTEIGTDVGVVQDDGGAALGADDGEEDAALGADAVPDASDELDDLATIAVGQQVTVRGRVVELIGDDGFAIEAEDGAGGEAVPVYTTTMPADLAEGTLLQIEGQVVEQRADTFAEDTGLEYGPEHEALEGDVVISASDILPLD